MEIRFIEASKTHSLRSQYLRPGRPLNESIYHNDDHPNTFHLGGYIDDNLVAVASFVYDNTSWEPLRNYYDKIQYYIRGVVCDPKYRNRGYTSMLISRGKEELYKRNCELVWGNSKIEAVDFWKKHGFDRVYQHEKFEKIGSELYIPIYHKIQIK